jgi:undecaprenyl pyrophosphate synthase
MELEVTEKLYRALDVFDGSFLYSNGDELILHKKLNIYFRIPDVSKASEFDYKILSFLSFYTASNHFRRSSKECKWAWNKINHWFRKEFAYEELQTIYATIGCGANRPLGVNFIESNTDMKLLTVVA